jgi:hypothetical protein
MCIFMEAETAMEMRNSSCESIGDWPSLLLFPGFIEFFVEVLEKLCSVIDQSKFAILAHDRETSKEAFEMLELDILLPNYNIIDILNFDTVFIISLSKLNLDSLIF